MDNSQELRTGRHCISHLHVHLVFTTKYRRAIFDDAALSHLKATFTNVCRDFGAVLTESNGQGDHVHLLVHYPPQVSISKLVNGLKGVASRLLRRDRPDLAQHYWKGSLWTPSYFAASCGGAPLEMIQQYVEQQRRGS